MHNDSPTYDYSICDIVSNLPIYMVKNEMLCDRVSDYRGYLQFKPPIPLIVSHIGFALFLKLSMIITDYICINQKSASVMFNSDNFDFV